MTPRGAVETLRHADTERAVQEIEGMLWAETVDPQWGEGGIAFLKRSLTFAKAGRLAQFLGDMKRR